MINDLLLLRLVARFVGFILLINRNGSTLLLSSKLSKPSMVRTELFGHLLQSDM